MEGLYPLWRRIGGGIGGRGAVEVEVGLVLCGVMVLKEAIIMALDQSNEQFGDFNVPLLQR